MPAWASSRSSLPRSSPELADQPLLTFYDDSTGERRELAATTLGELAGRVARLLREGCGLRAGDTVAIKAPPHASPVRSPSSGTCVRAIVC